MGKGTGNSGRLSSSQRSKIDTMYRFSASPARYAKGKVAVSAPAATGDIRMSQAARIAGDVGGKYSNRENAFIMSQSQYRRMQSKVSADKKEVQAMWRRRNREGL